MSYATGEAAALTLIQTLAAWGVSNSISTANDTTNKSVTLLQSGDSASYCILRPGEFEREALNVNQSGFVTRWQTVIELWVLRPTDGDAAEKTLATLRGDIINKLDAYYRLNKTSGVLWAMVTRGGEIKDGELEEQGKAFIRQEVVLEWDEETNVTQND